MCAGLTSLSLVTLGLTGAMAPANAIIEQDFPAAFGTPDGPSPTVTADVTVDDDTVDPGQTITYTVTSTLTAPKPGDSTAQTGVTNLTDFYLVFTPDPNAPIRQPRAADFQFPDGVSRSFSQPPKQQADGSWIFAFEGDIDNPPAPGLGGELTVTANLSATVAQHAAPGSTITAKAYTETSIFPKTQWDAPEPQFVNVSADGCSATAVGDLYFDGGDYGHWLAEMKFGPDMPNTILDPNAPQLTFRDASGADITDRILANA